MISETTQQAPPRIETPVEALSAAREIFLAMSDVEHPMHRDVRAWSKQDWRELADEAQKVIAAHEPDFRPNTTLR